VRGADDVVCSSFIFNLHLGQFSYSEKPVALLSGGHRHQRGEQRGKIMLKCNHCDKELHPSNREYFTLLDMWLPRKAKKSNKKLLFLEICLGDGLMWVYHKNGDFLGRYHILHHKFLDGWFRKGNTPENAKALYEGGNYRRQTKFEPFEKDIKYQHGNYLKKGPKGHQGPKPKPTHPDQNTLFS